MTMLAVGTLSLMALTALVYWREGLFTAATMFVNVILAGLAAFDFAGPLADLLEARAAGTPLAGYEDGLCRMALFGLALGLLRLATRLLAPKELDYAPALQRGGALAFGLLTGYLAAGFLICTLQTLPWPGYNAFADEHAAARAVLPDRAWAPFVPPARPPK
jgi:hypothetical protein